MILKSLVVGPLEVNCLVLACEETKEGIVIDPGDNVPGILEMVESDGIQVKEIVATHGHFDHIGRVKTLKEKLDVPFAIHEDDMFMVEGLVEIASFLDIETDEAPEVDRFIQIGETITFGNESMSVVHTPTSRRSPLATSRCRSYTHPVTPRGMSRCSDPVTRSSGTCCSRGRLAGRIWKGRTRRSRWRRSSGN